MMTSIKHNKKSFLEMVEQLDLIRKGKAENYRILEFIIQLMIDENEGRFSGAKMTQEFRTKMMSIKVLYGA